MIGAKVAARIAVVVSVVTLVVAVVGFVVTLLVNAFVLDRYNAYGEVPVPGSSSLHLSAGEVTVSFHTQVIGSPSGGGLPVPQLGMTIDPPADVLDPEVTESFGSTTTVNNDSRRRVWLVQVPVEGTYKITTDGQIGGFISPRLAFGHNSSYGFLVWVFVGLFVAGLIGLAASVWAARTRRVVSPNVSTRPETSYLPTGEGVTVEQLKTLATLRDSGALTGKEFEAEKRRIIDGG